MLDRRELVVEGGRLAWTRRPPDVKPPSRATATSSRYRRPTAVLGGEPSVASVSATDRAVGVADSAKIASSVLELADAGDDVTQRHRRRQDAGAAVARPDRARPLRRTDAARGRRPPPLRAL